MSDLCVHPVPAGDAEHVFAADVVEQFPSDLACALQEGTLLVI